MSNKIHAIAHPAAGSISQLLPIRDEQAWKYYQDAVACFWTAQELDLTHDRYDELQDVEIPIYRGGHTAHDACF